MPHFFTVIPGRHQLDTTGYYGKSLKSSMGISKGETPAEVGDSFYYGI
jgi:hypothetical protein